MSDAFAGFQSSFVASLFDTRNASPWAAQPAFAVYRNTVMSGCIDALQANFPSVARLVGAEWFRAAAARYVRDQPPRDERLLMYGESFAEFLDGFDPAHDLPYLAGVARLDRLWIESHTAADAPAVDNAWLASLTPSQLGGVRLRPHPAARCRLFEDMPILSIWASNRAGTAWADDLVWQGECALLTRPVDAVAWQAIDPCGIAFLDACAQGFPLAEAAGAALNEDAAVDMAALLARLLSAGALVRSTPKEARIE